MFNTSCYTSIQCQAAVRVQSKGIPRLIFDFLQTSNFSGSSARKFNARADAQAWLDEASSSRAAKREKSNSVYFIYPLIHILNQTRTFRT